MTSNRSAVTKYAVTGQTDQGFTVLLYDKKWRDYQVQRVYTWPEGPGEEVHSAHLADYDKESGDWSCNVACS